MKTHLNLATSDLPGSVLFYSTLLDTKPSKLLTDYALFITEEPGLELALDLSQKVSPAKDMHFGICVESMAEVQRAIERLTQQNLTASVEREETCCYANQTKVWATDPEGRRWEVYTVHKDTDERDDSETTCCSEGDGNRVCCNA